MCPQLFPRGVRLSAERAIILHVRGDGTVVAQGMLPAKDLTLALAPLGSALVTELSTTKTYDMVAAAFLLDDVPTLETLHPPHLAAELCCGIHRLPG